MKRLSLLAILAMVLTLSVGTVAQADGNHGRRGYSSHHYAPRSYGGHNRVIYRHGYGGPSRGYYGYGNPHYGQRVIYYNFFGLPVVTY